MFIDFMTGNLQFVYRVIGIQLVLLLKSAHTHIKSVCILICNSYKLPYKRAGKLFYPALLSSHRCSRKPAPSKYLIDWCGFLICVCVCRYVREMTPFKWEKRWISKLSNWIMWHFAKPCIFQTKRWKYIQNIYFTFGQQYWVPALSLLFQWWAVPSGLFVRCGISNLPNN